MTTRHGLVSLLLVLFAHGGMAGAQEVIRCGNSYGQQPCAGGSAVQAADPRSPAQRAQAAAIIERDLRLAREIEDARLKGEAQAQEARAKAAPPPPEITRAATGNSQRPGVFKAGSAKPPGDKPRKGKSATKKNQPPATPRTAQAAQAR